MALSVLPGVSEHCFTAVGLYVQPLFLAKIIGRVL